MKNIFLLLILLISQNSFCQKKHHKQPISVVISQKIKNSATTQLILKRLVSDSRCPENVTCMWAGEVAVEVAVFKNKKNLENKTLLFNPENELENKAWLESYFQKKIKNILVLPYPISGKKIDSKKYWLKIVFDEV